MGQRLLLVDSDRSFLKEHQVSLEAAFDLEVASSPEGVLSRLESGDFAAIFICVEVADNKGYALCSSIRKNAKLDAVKIVLISGKATEEEYRRHQSLKGRADVYLHKPIAPSALVAALTPLVPGRALDPDNPFGELVDTELGDDWLDSLKSNLDNQAAAPVFGVRPSSPAQTARLDAASGDVPPDSRHMKLLEDQVASLHEEMRLKDQRLATTEQRLQKAEAEAQQIQRQLNSVTLNLDELERSNRESEALKTRLAETEAALKALEESRGREGESAEMLKAQLKEALTERTDLILQVESLNHQVGEKSQRAIELLKERDRLLRENMDLEPFRAKAKDLEEALAAKGQEMGEALAARDRDREAVLAQKEEVAAALRQDLETAQSAQKQLNTTIEGMVQQQTNLEALHQSTLLELTNQVEKVHLAQMELAGLEATMRGQGRDLAELGLRLKQVEAERDAGRVELADREQKLLAGQEVIHQHQEEIVQLSARLNTARLDLDAAKIQHDGERLELMSGLDQKDAEIGRLLRTLGDQQEAHAALDREKQAVHGQLAEHKDRLQNLDSLLQDIQDKLRRGSDLARG
ncbi:MAG: response regulator [Acidobacteria bacterium]|nr:response regulator [Acidobacteriota bacterium]MBI3488708.1 response regulator [Acidobacteriota bacterium]